MADKFGVGIIDRERDALIGRVWLGDDGVIEHDAQGANVEVIEDILHTMRFNDIGAEMDNGQFVRSLPGRLNNQGQFTAGVVKDWTAPVDAGEPG